MFMRFLLPHWMAATWRSRTQISIRAELPSEKLPTHTGAADFLAQFLNDIIGTDTGSVFAGEIAAGQYFLNAILYLFDGLFRFLGTVPSATVLVFSRARIAKNHRIPLTENILRAPDGYACQVRLNESFLHAALPAAPLNDRGS